jgi:SAM-dependent methyltransferase
MNKSNYDNDNCVKASFDAAYTALTPHQYLHDMTAVNYRMADYMHPFLAAAVDASVSLSPSSQRPVRVLDLGCSYGVSGALLKTGCSYQELAKFFRCETSLAYSSCVTESKRWLESHVAREDVEVVGLDSSAEAIRFATASGMIDKGITRNFEENESKLTKDERSLIRQCDVLLSTGVIGYITEKTIHSILEAFGHDARGPLGPVAILSVLELFDQEPIAEAFAEYGYRFGQLPIRMPQRRFADEEEREGVLETLRNRGESTAVQDSEGQMFASLCVAAHPQSFEALAKWMTEVAEVLPEKVHL